jgi:hypothetical protein
MTDDTMTRRKSTYIYIPYITYKTTDKARRTTLNTRGELGCSDMITVPVPHMAQVVWTGHTTIYKMYT